MKKPNTSRNSKENDSFTITSSNFSASSAINEDKMNTKTQQIKLRRNLLQSNFKVHDNNDDISSPKVISENSSVVNNIPEEPLIPLISYKESYNYFQSLIYTNNANNIESESSGICSCSSSKTKKEKNFILNISRIRYDSNNSIHFRILFTIYYFFTKKNCEKTGEHWQDIGFQSDTPYTDLISVGMLGPLQILYGIDVYPNFYSQLFEYLVMRKCDLFFAVNLLSCSKFCLNILERGILDGQNNNLIGILNEIYVGMGYDFYNTIQNYGNNNILTIEFIVKTLQKISEKRTQINYFLGNHQKNN